MHENTFHQYVSTSENGRCEVCGLAEYAVAHRQFLAAPYDHGSSTWSYASARFAGISEAIAWASEQPHGRKTSFTGRNIEDITWYVRDLAADDFASSIVASVSGPNVVLATAA